MSARRHDRPPPSPAQAPAPEPAREAPGPDNSGALTALGVRSFTDAEGQVWRRGTDGAWTCVGGRDPSATGRVLQPGDPAHARIEAEAAEAEGGEPGGAADRIGELLGGAEAWWRGA